MDLISPTKNLQRSGVQQVEELYSALHGWGQAVDLNESGVPEDGLLFLALKRDGFADSIGLSTGPVQPGRAYTGACTVAITGLLTTDAILADSTDQPTCSVNGTLTIADGDVVYGVSISRSGVQIGYYPCGEGAGTSCINTLPGPGALPHGTISASTVHIELYDGSGFDSNMAGYTLSENLSLYSNPGLGSWVFGASANPQITADGTLIQVVDSFAARGAGPRTGAIFEALEVVHYKVSLRAPTGLSGTIRLGDASGATSGDAFVAVKDQWQTFTVTRTFSASPPVLFCEPAIRNGGTLGQVYFKDFQVCRNPSAFFAQTYGTAVPYGLKPHISGGRSGFSGVLVGLGDSITAGDWPVRLPYLMPNNPTIIDAGNAGDTIAQCYARVPAVISANADICVILCGINDFAADATVEEMQADYEPILVDLIEGGVTPVIVSTTPWKDSTNWSAPRQVVQDQFNAWLPSIAATYGCTFVDAFTPMEDPASPDKLLPAYSLDLMHHSAAGVAAMTEIIERALPGTRVSADAYTNRNAQYPTQIKLSILDPPQWPSSPAILLRTGVDNAVYDADGVGIVFDTPTLALAALASLADDTYLFGGTKGAALYSVDKSAKAAVIKKYLADND